LQRLRHFADWSNNSAEFHVLREVQRGFVETFIDTKVQEPHVPKAANMEHWLAQWSKLMSSACSLHDFPLWLQYFSKIIFLVINKSGKFPPSTARSDKVSSADTLTNGPLCVGISEITKSVGSDFCSAMAVCEISWLDG
jgi:hypothetical protein